MADIHVVDPVRNLVLNLHGQKLQVPEGRVDYYSDRVTVRSKDPDAGVIVLEVPPADQGKRTFGKRTMLRVIGYDADTLEQLPGTLTWTQVCSCNAAKLKKELLALEPVPLTEPEAVVEPEPEPEPEAVFEPVEDEDES